MMLKEILKPRNHWQKISSREISVLYTINRAAAQSLEINGILNDALDATLESLGVEAGGIILLEPDGETMTLCVHRGFSDEFIKNVKRFKLGEGILGQAAAKRKPVVIDVSGYPPARLAPFIVREGLQTIASTPLISADKLLGALNLATRSVRAFPPEELELLAAIGSELAIAVRNAQLYEQTQKELAERKRAENALRASEEKYRSLVESTEDSIYMVDQNCSYLFMNTKHKSRLGLAAGEQYIGRKYSEFHSSEETNRFAESVHRVFETGMLEQHEHEYGGKRFLRTLSPVKDLKTSIINAVTVISMDITEKKKVEEIRLEKERLAHASRTKSEFIASMSHELRTPLNAIIGFSELLTQMGGKMDEKQLHYVDNILTAGKHLLAIISDILDLSKVEAGKIELAIENVPVHETINETLTLIKEKAAKHNIVIRKEIDPQLQFIEADKLRLKQILFNLLDNAVKFSKKEGGTVTITTKKEDDLAKISVSDTGIGIKKEDIGKLFKEFIQIDSEATRKYGGTGLGLAITKKLVELHGGKITVESKYGEGTTFTFIMPLAAKKKTTKTLVMENLPTQSSPNTHRQ